MCSLKASQIHERPFRAAKDHVQLLAALDSFLPNGKNMFLSLAAAMIYGSNQNLFAVRQKGI